MSLDYSFYISTTLGPETLMRTFLLGLGLPWDPKDPCSTDAPRFAVSVGPQKRDSREFRREQFGFAPDQYFVFRTWGEYAYEASEEITRGTLAICQAVPGDAVLLFNGEIVLYMRTAG